MNEHDTDQNTPTPPHGTGADSLASAARQADLDQSFADLRARLQAALPQLELGECLGRGGAGAVFRAHQQSLDRTVAVKVLLPPPSEASGWAERFRREAQSLARLQHPGIVAVHDFGQDGDLAWLVMEYVDGANLRALLDAGRLAPSEALAIVGPICEALQYAHDQGIVHRDVKPENVLVDAAGRVKLVDFGLAKLTARGGSAPNLTRTDQAMGTPRYMAPEQLERPREVDHRADIFSLGVVLYEMLTGHVPAGVVEPPSRRVKVDVRLDDVVLRALQRDPALRYQSATDLEVDIGRASEVAAATAPEHGADTPRRARAGLTLADLVAALVPFLLAFVMVSTLRAGDASSASAAGTSILWSQLMPLVLTSGLWWGLPTVSAVHWFVNHRRKRTVAPSMPVVRVVWALSLTALQLWVLAGLRDIAIIGQYRDLVHALNHTILASGLVVAVLGAWSVRGAHRRLVSPTLERALFGLTVAFAAIPVAVAAAASFAGTVAVFARSAIHGQGLAIAVHLPVVAAGVLAWVFARSGELRRASLVLGAAAAGTLLIHVLGSIGYAGFNGVVFGCLGGAVLVGLIGAAASAE